jgi:tetratricopeptide (TPR) repeat protein
MTSNILATTLIGLVLAGPVSAQILPITGSRGYIVYGIVYMPDGSPARRAQVRITGSFGLDRQVYTDPNGRYEFRDVAGGRYSLTASSLDDPDLTCDKVLFDSSQAANNIVQFGIYLRNRPDQIRTEAPSPAISAGESAQRIPKPAQKAFEEGQKAGSEGRLDRAEKSFTKALEAFPNYTQALAERGNIRVATGRLADAKADFAKALEIDPQYGPALRGSGICKFQEGKPAEAAEDLEKAVAAEPNSARDYLYLGLTRMSLGQREPARAAFQRALSLDPVGSVRAHVHLANLYIQGNQAAEALAEIDAYLSAVPDAPDRDKLVAVQNQLKAVLKK